MVDIERGNGEWGMGNFAILCDLRRSLEIAEFPIPHSPFPIPQLNFKIPRLIPRQSKCPRPMKMFGEWGMGNGT